MRRRRFGAMVLSSLGLAFAAGTAALSLQAARYVPRIAPGVRVASVELGGLTLDEARPLLEAWWGEIAAREIALESSILTRPLGAASASQLRLELNVEATLARLPLEDFVSFAKSEMTPGAPTPRVIPPSVAYRPGGLDGFRADLAARVPSARPARVTYARGAVTRRFEVAGFKLDDAKFKADFLAAVLAGAPRIELPLSASGKRVPDEALLSIREPISSYTTKFNAGDRNRTSNIRLAASRIDGSVVMPGERFSFNGAVGRRTPQAGYRLAGIYRNGQRDVDIGGGVCQVSSTLYNAVLLADLKVVARSCHSLTVPYVPLGRDAAVSYGAIDLAFENDSDRAVALSAAVDRGSITFRVLGTKEPGKEVRVVSGPAQHFGRATKYVVDASLPPGKKVVDQPGGSAHRVTTYRVVFRDGVEERRETLSVSHYRGGVRIVRHNPGAPGPKPPADVGPAPTVPPSAESA